MRLCIQHGLSRETGPYIGLLSTARVSSCSVLPTAASRSGVASVMNRVTPLNMTPPLRQLGGKYPLAKLRA